jgi:1-acyl-sn-glycerol-3-phosphate acyltransferase
MTWDGAPHPAFAPMGPAAWLRVARRGVPMVLVLVAGLAVLLAMRLVERPLCGLRRPVTPQVTVFVCRACLRLLGLRRVARGVPLRGAGAVVANHVSWLDIFALNAGKRIYFVSKAEVARWPGIGWLARATGTLFIRRDRREARDHADQLSERLAVGHTLLFFPEGTSTDGLRLLPFKTTLFAAFFAPGLPEGLRVQPVSLAYRAPDGAAHSFYGWWGTQSAGQHMLAMLAAPRHGTVTVTYHEPLPVEGDRKTLARAAEAAVRSGLAAEGVLKAA